MWGGLRQCNPEEQEPVTGVSVRFDQLDQKDEDFSLSRLAGRKPIAHAKR